MRVMLSRVLRLIETILVRHTAALPLLAASPGVVVAAALTVRFTTAGGDLGSNLRSARSHIFIYLLFIIKSYTQY